MKKESDLHWQPVDAASQPSSPASNGNNVLHMRRLGIDTYQELVVYIRSDSHICKSEGFEAQSRVEVRRGER